MTVFPFDASVSLTTSVPGGICPTEVVVVAVSSPWHDARYTTTITRMTTTAMRAIAIQLILRPLVAATVASPSFMQVTHCATNSL